MTIKQKQIKKQIISLTKCHDHCQYDLFFICCLTKTNIGQKMFASQYENEDTNKAREMDKATSKKEE